MKILYRSQSSARSAGFMKTLAKASSMITLRLGQSINISVNVIN